MATSVGKPNAVDQKVQTVLFIMGKLDSKYGIDGQRGDDTIIGMGDQLFISDCGLEASCR